MKPRRLHRSLPAVRRTTVELDLEAVRRAQELLGTSTIRETIDRALREVDRHAALRAGADLIRGGRLEIVRPGDVPRLRKSRQ
jgi:Arc/MetJ family transcription regulator